MKIVLLYMYVWMYLVLCMNVQDLFSSEAQPGSTSCICFVCRQTHPHPFGCCIMQPVLLCFRCRCLLVEGSGPVTREIKGSASFTLI